MEKQFVASNRAAKAVSNVKSSGPTSASDTAVGDTLLGRGLDILAGQLQKLRELTEAARHMSEDATRERSSLHQIQEEVTYRLRFINENLKANENIDEGTHQRRQGLLEKVEVLGRRDQELGDLIADMEDSAKRLSLLIRQLELAGSHLTRSHTANGKIAAMPEANAWQIALRAQLIEGQEEERSRLAREIHDGPAQVMANAVMQVEFCSQLLQKDKGQATQELDALKLTMRDSLLDLRRVMFNLRPTALAEQGIAVTLQQYATDFTNRYGLKVEVQVPEMQHSLSSDQEMAVFRVVQEALQNARKHSEATRVEIYASLASDGSVHFSVRDDGRGFDTKKLTPTLSNGSGIPGMRERIEVVGGKFRIKSKFGYGTEIVLILWPHGVK